MPQSEQETPIYFDDISIGQRYKTPGRTITEADIVNFAGLSADYNSLHVDDEYAAKSPYGARVAHGLLVLAVTSGLTTRLNFSSRLSPSILGLLEVTCKWPNPTFAGDTVHVVVTVDDTYLTSSETKGIIELSRTTVNQRAETVMDSNWKLLIGRHEENAE